MSNDTADLLDQLAARLHDTLVSPQTMRARRAGNIAARHRKLTYGDQKGQVDFLINSVFNYAANGLPRGGYFVDLACADGVHLSNTYFLEKHLGWSGLLFEPNPGFHANIAATRSAPLITDCVTDRAGETVRFRIDNGMSGGIVSEDTDNSTARRAAELAQATVLDVPTTTLAAELARAGAPDLIDFMSLDIEGAEWIALRDFPFQNYRFRCLAIERPNPQLDLLLDAQGYRQVAHLNFDTLYVHADFLAGVNFHPDIHFAFTPPKDT